MATMLIVEEIDGVPHLKIVGTKPDPDCPKCLGSGDCYMCQGNQYLVHNCNCPHCDGNIECYECEVTGDCDCQVADLDNVISLTRLAEGPMQNPHMGD